MSESNESTVVKHPEVIRKGMKCFRVDYKMTHRETGEVKTGFKRCEAWNESDAMIDFMLFASAERDALDWIIKPESAEVCPDWMNDG